MTSEFKVSDEFYDAYLRWTERCEAGKTKDLTTAGFTYKPLPPETRNTLERRINRMSSKQRDEYIERITAGFEAAVETWAGGIIESIERAARQKSNRAHR